MAKSNASTGRIIECRRFQPGGLADGSRELSKAPPPVKIVPNAPDPEGVEENRFINPFLHPSGVRIFSVSPTGGIARCALLNPRLPSFIPPG
jgi:hypothetical protein